ncbi:Trehalose synthase [Labilithrix luteola]|uniref:Maltokinase n=1 Tax=Labilithrix luteola TaxID=1391654 RepID=A0A0K1Q4Z5_9BACT|nr:putative maltokinase [Labilithrix luteola]AKV00722.1 Trehalose synthase [Labilithrix luteola]
MIPVQTNVANAPVEVEGSWNAAFDAPSRAPLERALATWIMTRRWYRTKSREVTAARVRTSFTLPSEAPAKVLFVDVALDDGRTDTYVVPLAVVHGDEAETFRRATPGDVVMPLTLQRDGEHEDDGVMIDGLACPRFLRDWLDAFETARTIASDEGGQSRLRFQGRDLGDGSKLAPKRLAREQTNTSVFYGDRFVGKVVRKLDEGVSPDLDMGRGLTEGGYAHTPALAGWVELESGDEPSTVGLIHAQVPNRGDAWEHVLGVLDEWLATVRGAPPNLGPGDLFDHAMRPRDAVVTKAIGPYVNLAELLGRRIGEMHVVLAGHTGDRAFTPMVIDASSREALVAMARRDLTKLLDRLAQRDSTRAESDVRTAADEATRTLLRHRHVLFSRLDRVLGLDDAGVRMRVHGDLHLGQVLFTGTDFALIDFEGEPARPLDERKAKRSPLVDVAGMLRSFDYAAASALRKRSPDEQSTLAPWARFWRDAVSSALLGGWLSSTAKTTILPASIAAKHALLDFYLLEKAIYEVHYEMDNRPDWIDIPLGGLLAILERHDPLDEPPSGPERKRA